MTILENDEGTQTDPEEILLKPLFGFYEWICLCISVIRQKHAKERTGELNFDTQKVYDIDIWLDTVT